jgi:hypothetical protein
MKLLSLLLILTLFASCTQQGPRFQLVKSESSGIDFVNAVIEKDSFNILHNEYMYNGGGVGVGDLNNDGLPDLVFSGNKVRSEIYLNSGNFTFKKITENFSGLDNKQWLSGICIVDINADGWNDVYFTSTMSKDSVLRRNQLWINQGLNDRGEPYFQEEALKWGIADTGHSMHAAFFDYDLDGDLDLYVLNNIIIQEVPTNYRPKIVNGKSINNDHLYENTGNGNFREVTISAGIVYEGYGLGLAIGDVNKDGYPDIYISNDYIANDLLYINQRNGTFKNQSKQYLSYQSRFSMGNDMADMNNDGLLDVITVDMMPEQYFRKKQTINGNSYFVYVNNEKYGYDPQYVRNMLHVHNGFLDSAMIPYSEVGQLAGIYQTEWSWSPLLADFDNDGDKDLFITNGFPKDLTDKDFTNYKAQVYGSLADDAHMIERIPIVKVPNYAFENKGNLQFVNQTEAWGMNVPSFSNGAAFVDLDNDGDLDYVVNNINDPAFVYRNLTRDRVKDYNYLRVDVRGENSNTGAIGTRVELWSNGTYQYAEKHLSRGYISGVDPVLHFGLGKAQAVDSLRITWPDGKRETILKNVSVNQVITAHERDALPRRLNVTSPTNYLFAKAEGIINYSHEEKDYVDFFQGQAIIQHKFSQVGPCMVKGDLNGDGLDDVLVGSTIGQPTRAFLNSGSKFVESNIPGLTGTKVGQESDMLLVDIDKDGDIDVIAASGGYALEDEKLYRHVLYRNENGVFVREELPIPSYPASVIRSADFDQDGDLDVFIAARIRKWNFPLSLSSYLLINENGKLTIKADFAFDAGMVTDATWSDYDGDGWEDLLITRELNAMGILKNKQGKAFEWVQDKSLTARNGFWYSIASGDFDGDGDPDYIVGNLGANNRFTISNKYPFRVYAIDLDKNGFIDPLATSYWKDQDGVMQEYPVNYLDELAAQSPFFRKMFTSYTKFSYTTAQEIINPDTISSKNIYFANTTLSYILWNDKGKFTWQALPTMAQVSPIRKMLVHDFNGDGIDDALLAGNDHSFDVSTGIYDANKGLILLGSRTRDIAALPPARTGLVLNGQVESLLLFTGDQPFIIAGINRRDAVTYKLVNSTKPKNL